VERQDGAEETRVSQGPSSTSAGTAPVVFEDEASATASATHLDPAFGRRFAERALDALVVVRGSRVLDVACGTGIFARLAARVVGPSGRVVAVNTSAPALHVARRVDISRTVEWTAWDGGRLPFDAATFDVVACQHTLARVPHPAALVTEMRRVLVPGGRLGITTWGPIEENPAFAAELDAAITAGLGGSGVVDALVQACSLHRVDDLRQMVAGAGLTDVSCRTVRMLAQLRPVAEWVRIYPSLPPLSAAWNTFDQHSRIQFLSRASELLRPFEHEGVLRVQASSRLLVARAPNA